MMMMCLQLPQYNKLRNIVPRTAQTIDIPDYHVDFPSGDYHFLCNQNQVHRLQPATF